MIKEYLVSGMSCAMCARTIENETLKIDGVKSASVNFAKNTIRIEMDIDYSDIINQRLKLLGYELVLTKKENNNKDIIKLLISVSLLLLLMFVSMGEMLGINMPTFLDNNIIKISVELVILTPIVVLNFHYFKDGIMHLIKLRPDMNTLVSLSSITSIILGLVTLIILIVDPDSISMDMARNQYFDSAGMILVFVSIGKLIENKSKNRVYNEIKELEKLESKTCRVIVNNIEYIKDINEVKVDDIILVKASEMIPLDGVVLEGGSIINEASITGESVPRKVCIGSTVISSNINLSSALYIRVTSDSKSSTIRRIINQVNECSNSKANVSKLVDKISLYFVPFVMLVSILSFVIHMITKNGFYDSINYLITTLVVACPCALGLATPISILVGTIKASKLGFMINSINSLEKARKIKTIVFDKTGTLTSGKLSVIKEERLVDVYEKYSILFALENNINHSYSEAIINYLKDKNVNKINSSNNEYIIGEGASLLFNGTKYYIGSKSYLNKILNIDSLEDDNVLYFFSDKELISKFYIEDKIRKNAKELINVLKKKGYKTVMITGDKENIALKIGNELGIDDVYFEAKPLDKIKIVEELEKESEVMMIGDGINDTIALKRANVGVSLSSSTDAAKVTADIVLLRNDIYDLYNVIRLSNRIINTIKISLIWAFCYNLISIIIATGLIKFIKMSPMVASILMSISSIFVVLVSLTINLFKRKELKINMKEVRFKIDGMMCMHCVKRVVDTLKAIEGVKEVKVSIEEGAIVEGYELDEKVLKDAVVNLGYKVK